MLQQKIQKAREEDGFTLIELLVVILIIGILAAIALPTFLGQSDKAKDSSAKSNARNAVTQIESCIADGGATADLQKCATRHEPFAAATDNPDLKQFKKTVSTPVGTDGKLYKVTSQSDAGTDHDASIEKVADGYVYTGGTKLSGLAGWQASGAGTAVPAS